MTSSNKKAPRNKSPRNRSRNKASHNKGSHHQSGDSQAAGHDSSNDQGTDNIITGILEMHPRGYGFIRDRENDYSRTNKDPFVPTNMINRYRLREGVLIEARIQRAKPKQGPRVQKIITLEGMQPEDYSQLPQFDKLTPMHPFEHIRLELGSDPKRLTVRVMDLLTPIGKGQRALIVAPPRTGKTVLLQHIAESVSENHPELELMVMLIDERPEEVTEMRRSVKGEVIASSMDRDIESHVRTAQLIVERAKRLAESGKQVFLLWDSITRTARAFNKVVGNTGRTMSGGVDVRALDIPKKLFGGARRFEEGGSLTIVATALIETGSRMDEVIFQEFKGTGNMELVLDRKLADRRVWPSIDISQSGTRKEEKLLDAETLERVTMLRRSIVTMHHVEAMEELVKKMSKYTTNSEFLELLGQFTI
ncbi:MAG: transcription termination factor Rho [Planctomycetota bacterium]|nr:transcription termination factor Rho [Planctomycetota bacterium]